MRVLGLMMVLTPLLLAACGGDSDAPAMAAPAPARPGSAPAPTAADAVPLRQTPEGLLAFPVAPGSSPGAPAGVASATAAPPADEDAPPTEAQVRALYEGIIYTYAFDACGLPLIGQTARQDIEQRIEICPNPPLRKDAFRTIYHRAIETAEQNPEKMRTTAGQACPDKREFLRRVMSHADELQFDDNRPADCGLLSPASPGAAPANPTADGSEPARGQKPF